MVEWEDENDDDKDDKMMIRMKTDVYCFDII